MELLYAMKITYVVTFYKVYSTALLSLATVFFQSTKIYQVI